MRDAVITLGAVTESRERPDFVNVEHAALNGLQGGRLVACRYCVAAVMAALMNGHEN